MKSRYLNYNFSNSIVVTHVDVLPRHVKSRSGFIDYRFKNNHFYGWGYESVIYFSTSTDVVMLCDVLHCCKLAICACLIRQKPNKEYVKVPRNTVSNEMMMYHPPCRMIVVVVISSLT